VASKSEKAVPQSAGVILLKSLKERTREMDKKFRRQPIDLGDGVVCCEFHAK